MSQGQKVTVSLITSIIVFLALCFCVHGGLFLHGVGAFFANLSFTLKIAIAAVAFTTLFLILFFVWNIQPTDSFVIKSKIKQFQYEVLREYLDAHEKADWADIAHLVSSKKYDLSRELKRTLKCKSAEENAHIDELFDKSWQELIGVLNKTYNNHPATGKTTTDEIKVLLEELLSRTGHGSVSDYGEYEKHRGTPTEVAEHTPIDQTEQSAGVLGQKQESPLFTMQLKNTHDNYYPIPPANGANTTGKSGALSAHGAAVHTAGKNTATQTASTPATKRTHDSAAANTASAVSAVPAHESADSQMGDFVSAKSPLELTQTAAPKTEKSNAYGFPIPFRKKQKRAAQDSESKQDAESVNCTTTKTAQKPRAAYTESTSNQPAAAQSGSAVAQSASAAWHDTELAAQSESTSNHDSAEKSAAENAFSVKEHGQTSDHIDTTDTLATIEEYDDIEHIQLIDADTLQHNDQNRTTQNEDTTFMQQSRFDTDTLTMDDLFDELEQIDELEPIEDSRTQSGLFTLNTQLFPSYDEAEAHDVEPIAEKPVSPQPMLQNNNAILLKDGVYTINDTLEPSDATEINYNFKRLVDSVLK